MQEGRKERSVNCLNWPPARRLVEMKRREGQELNMRERTTIGRRYIKEITARIYVSLFWVPILAGGG